MTNNPILSLGAIFLLSFFASRLTKKFKLPVITAYVILGIILNLLGLISAEILSASNFLSNLVLGMIAFSLGSNLSFDTIRKVGKAVASISISASLLPWLLVTAITWLLFRQPLYVAVILGAISAATDPAAVAMVVQESRAKGEFTDTLLGVVAIDDAWALIIFGFSLSFAQGVISQSGTFLNILGDLLGETLKIGAAFLSGGAVALALTRFSRFINTVKERLVYTFGFLFLAIGLAIVFNLSILLSCMFFGAVLTNINKKSFQFFDSLQEIDAPLYLIFFVLVGAGLNMAVFSTASVLTLGFIAFRALGKIAGSFIGANIANASTMIKKYMGQALIPQAGVALACALVAKHAIGGIWGDKILAVTVASTIIFEIFGPWITKAVLIKCQELPESQENPTDNV